MNIKNRTYYFNDLIKLFDFDFDVEARLKNI